LPEERLYLEGSIQKGLPEEKGSRRFHIESLLEERAHLEGFIQKGLSRRFHTEEEEEGLERKGLEGSLYKACRKEGSI
jgi:hypothetical protein